MQHSHTGPSRANMWLNCEAFREMSALAPPEEEQFAAQEGKCGHAAAATAIDAVIYDTLPLVGQEFEGMELTEELAVFTNEYTFYIRAQVQIAQALGGTFHQYTEKRIDLTWVHPKFFGTADNMIVLLAGNSAEVVDLKLGRTIVEADDPQLMCYALRIVKDYPHIEQIMLTIVQPRANHIGGSIRSVTKTREELLAFAAVAAKMQDLNYQDNRPATAGTWCCWCPAAGICGAHAAWIFEKVPYRMPRTDLITPEMVDDILNNQKQIETFIKRVAAAGLEMAKRGQRFKTQKVVMTKAPARPKDVTPEEVQRLAKKLTGKDVDLDKIAPRKVTSITKIREQYGDAVAQLFTQEGAETMSIRHITDKGVAIAVTSLDTLINTPIPEYKK